MSEAGDYSAAVGEFAGKSSAEESAGDSSAEESAGDSSAGESSDGVEAAAEVGNQKNWSAVEIVDQDNCSGREELGELEQEQGLSGARKLKRNTLPLLQTALAAVR